MGLKPEVYFIGETCVRDSELQRYLTAIGAPDFSTDAPTEGEKLVEIMGRICYKSFKPGLNPNVGKIREGNKDYIGNILAHNHGSVAEHITFNFIFRNVSRVFTHELVRHRAGTAVSQESMRYVRHTSACMDRPDCFNDDAWVNKELNEIETFLTEKALKFSKHYNLDSEKDFGRKKELTSAIRRFMPEGQLTTIGWSVNPRALINILLMRTHPSAEEEMRVVFGKLGELIRVEYPNLFQDIEVVDLNGYPWYSRRNGKF